MKESPSIRKDRSHSMAKRNSFSKTARAGESRPGPGKAQCWSSESRSQASPVDVERQDQRTQRDDPAFPGLGEFDDGSPVAE